MADTIYRFIRFWGKPLFMAVYRPVIIGAENIPKKGGAVIAGNHIHALDPVFIDICTGRVVRTLAKSELFDGAFGFVFRGIKAIPVKLSAAKNPAALLAAEEAVRDGSLVNISPEAKRNYTDFLLLPFKYGAVKIAQDTGCPIIPYAVSGNYKAFSKRMTVSFGKPFYSSGDLREDNRRLYNEVTRLLLEISGEKSRGKTVRSFEEWEDAVES